MSRPARPFRALWLRRGLALPTSLGNRARSISAGSSARIPRHLAEGAFTILVGICRISWFVLWTLAAGFRILFRDRPWQPYLLCAYVVFVAHLGLGTIIDIDHWRHVYMLLGLIWGAVALEQRH